MITEELLSILVCPENRTKLALADASLLSKLNEAIAAQRLTNRAGELLDEQLDAALVREDRTIAYPVVDQIPNFLVESGIPLAQLAN
ncbi:MAG TPA: hypothetical protein VHD36_01325 [Pirellulales bacterium]|nr:hypothetical protein [Pirellulales bacterium]